MELRVVGSGVGRTGTTSLKAALERLLGAPCYHMMECFARPDDPAVWTAAMRDETVDWDVLLADYAATVDWPAAACWKELAEHFPDALILHSERPAEEWYRSADRTILHSLKDAGAADRNDPWMEMARAMFHDRFTPDVLDHDAAVAAFDAWNADVRATADADRLLIWRPGDGWDPICDALGVDVPDEPFPHANTTEDFRKMAGLD